MELGLDNQLYHKRRGPCNYLLEEKTALKNSIPNAQSEHHYYIPAELRALPRWVCVRAEERGGKTTKVPYNAKTGRKASSTDPATWATFDMACRAAARYDGIGFVLGDGIAGIDLDHCVNADTGGLEDWAQVIVDSFASYSEISFSGTGVHVLIKGALPGGGHKKGGIECYSSGRYFTMSGKPVPGGVDTIEDRQDELTAFVARVFPPDAPKPKPAPQRAALAPDLTDAALLDRARHAKNGAAFSALYDRGDLSGHGNDASRADIALCHCLAFWLGNDDSAIDTAFRSSALMRDKWDARRGEGTYGERTVTCAIASTSTVYEPRIPVPAQRTWKADVAAMKDSGADAEEVSGDCFTAMIQVALHGLPVALGPDAMSLIVLPDISETDYRRVFHALNGLRKQIDAPLKFLLADAYWQIGRDSCGEKIAGSRGLKKEWVEATFHDLASQISKWASVASRWPSDMRPRQDEQGNFLTWSWFEQNRNLPDAEKERLVKHARESCAKAHKEGVAARKEAGLVSLPRTMTERIRRLVADRGEDYVLTLLRLAVSGQTDALVAGTEIAERETFPIYVDIRHGMFLGERSGDASGAADNRETFHLELFSDPPADDDCTPDGFDALDIDAGDGNALSDESPSMIGAGSSVFLMDADDEKHSKWNVSPPPATVPERADDVLNLLYPLDAAHEDPAADQEDLEVNPPVPALSLVMCNAPDAADLPTPDAPGVVPPDAGELPPITNTDLRDFRKKYYAAAETGEIFYFERRKYSVAHVRAECQDRDGDIKRLIAEARSRAALAHAA